MQINIDTNRIKRWCLLHLNWIIPLGFFGISWFFVKMADSTTNGIQLWYATMAVGTIVGGFIFTLLFFMRFFDLQQR